MSETWRGSYVYSSLGAAARHIQQHFPSVYLCTYNILSLLWASHSCYSSIHLLTHFAVFSLCSPLCAELCFGHFSHSLSLNSLGRLFSVCLLVFFLICCFVSVHLGNLFPSQPFCWTSFSCHILNHRCLLPHSGNRMLLSCWFVPVCFSSVSCCS